MIARFIVRLLTADGDLLAWTEVRAEAKPQGRPRSTPFMAVGPSTFVIEQDGTAEQMSIHWPDLDVVRVAKPMESTPVQVGQVFTFTWSEPVWMVEGSKVDVPMPPVTVRANVRIGIPVGTLNAVGR
jgi:hypothetical protein